MWFWLHHHEKKNFPLFSSFCCMVFLLCSCFSFLSFYCMVYLELCSHYLFCIFVLAVHVFWLHLIMFLWLSLYLTMFVWLHLNMFLWLQWGFSLRVNKAQDFNIKKHISKLGLPSLAVVGSLTLFQQGLLAFGNISQI